MNKRIGIIGYGTIGSYLFKKISQEAGLEVAFVSEVVQEKLSGLPSSLIVNSLEEARRKDPDLIVEVAGQEWVKRYGSVVLEFSDLLVASAGALVDVGLQEQLENVAQANRTQFYVSHGAIIGLDGVRDGREMIEEVRITTVRPQEGYGLKERLSKRTILYEGPTRMACQLFPHNVNIHASLALHGLGFDRTHSTVVADPESKVMKHSIEIKGWGFEWHINVESKPLGERTGTYVPESIFQTVKRICSKKYGMNLI
jgi:aspartate dehydrogenase